MSIDKWDENPNKNTNAPPNGAPNNMQVRDIGEVLRGIMASVRKWYDDPDWVDYGHAGVWQSPRVFKVLGDQTSKYTPSRAIRFNLGAFASYDYVNFSEWRIREGQTYVTVLGALPASIQNIALGVLTKNSLPMNWMDRAIPAEGFIYKPKKGEAYATTEVYLKNEVDDKFLSKKEAPTVLRRADGELLAPIIEQGIKDALLSPENFPSVTTPASSFVRLPPDVYLMFGSVLMAPWGQAELSPEGPAKMIMALFCNPTPMCTIGVSQVKNVSIKNNTARRVQCSWLALGQ
jgi:hypothetical protein